MEPAILSYNIKQPKFSDFKEPRVVCLITANGGGTKLLQSYLDSHPQLYNIPAYPLLYFYPHWEKWEKELADNWNWASIIDMFCYKHASVIDSRRIKGMNGLDRLGENRDEYVSIDEELFRFYLRSILREEEIKRRTFLLAVQYAYSLCKGEDISKKLVFLWHHHAYEYIEECMKDFPDAILIGMIRDPRPKVYRSFRTYCNVNDIKLNETDSMIYRSRVFYNANLHIFGKLQRLKPFIDEDRVYFIRHEDLALNLEGIMKGLSSLLGIEFIESMLTSTYDGKIWWGHEVYDIPNETGKYKDVSKAIERVVSKEWQKRCPKIEVFVLEGIFFDFYKKYKYDLLYYKKDTILYRILLCMAILWPFRIERQVFLFYFSPRSHICLLSAAYKESKSKTRRKDYTWNATYHFKWNYAGLNLWKPRWYRRFLDFSEDLALSKKVWSVFIVGLLFISRILYIFITYMRFWFAGLTYPLKYFKRVGLYYSCFFRRINNRLYLAKLFEVEE